MTNNKARPTISFLLSVCIHALIWGAIIYTGLDWTLPEGTVTTTELEFTVVAVPQGNQTEDSRQIVNRVAKTVRPKAKAPPPPPPPPKVVDEFPENNAEDFLLADDAEDPFSSPPSTPQPKPQARPLPVMGADSKSESNKDTLDDIFDQQSREDIESSLYAQNSRERESSLNNEDVLDDSYFTESDLDTSGNSNSSETAYGISSGARSDTELTPIPGNVPPEYPMWARLRRHEGTVLVEFEVNRSGHVENTRVVQSSGYEHLDDSALRAHRRWRYRPGKTGTFVKAYIFSLKGDAQEIPAQLRRGQ